MSTAATSPLRASTLARRYRLTVADYHRMGEVGILGPEAGTELIDGEIIDMPPFGRPHAGTVNMLANRLKEAVGPEAVVAVQNPVRLDGHSGLLPDLALLHPRADYYRNANPGPADVLLLIEVADSSLAYDCDIKLPRFARAGIAEVWLVDLGGSRLSIHRRATGDGYIEGTTPNELSAVSLPLGPDRARSVDLSGLF